MYKEKGYPYYSGDTGEPRPELWRKGPLRFKEKPKELETTLLDPRVARLTAWRLTRLSKLCLGFRV